MTEFKRIALLGTGLIGGPMAKRLMQSGYQLTVYNRTTSKTDALKNAGAKVAQTPKEAIESTECSILVLADAGAIRETLFSNPDIDFANRTIIQMGTILPGESIAFKNKISTAGGQYFESPVLGSIPQATEGRLIVMVGSTPEQFEQWKNLLQCFGEEIHYLGTVGKAAALKLALNQLIASLTAAFSLSLGIVQRSEVDVNTFMGILRKSALYAPTFDKKLQRMLNRDFSDPNFPTKHLLKDVSLIQEEAKNLGLSTQLVDGVIDLIKLSMEKGFAETDYSAIYNAVNPSINKG